MSQEMPGSALPVQPEPTKSPLERIIGVFISPKATFEDINRKPDWIVPAVLILLVALAITYVFLSHADMLELIKAQIEKSGRPVPPDEALQSGLKVSMIFSYVVVVVVVPLSLVVVSGVLYAIFSFMMGAETTFKKMFAMNAYASMPSLLKSIIAIPILFVKQPTEFGNPADIVQSNLSILIDPSNKALYALGKSIDLFVLWYLIVLAIGVVGVSKNLTLKKSLTTIIIIWAIVVACVVGWAAIKK
ncbi:MAG: Yip1 family protein [Terriglobia bacterium]